ncbi:NAD-dependent epimerase/dehydratase family protein [Paraburkholderia flava]|uniref:NAD-dependent epimerase/dehydratase family protein n=1 Tax=Paraburkholderia flava TaxID=2547393 RepID=UPI001060A813|nr:NAD-dependent epimerase/dehydratase family protein [Paraburkholderia flava]
MSRMLVTGANGFVGRAACDLLVAEGHQVTGLVRRTEGCIAGVDKWIDASRDFSDVERTWPASFVPDCVVHLAARVHVMDAGARNADEAFRETNVDGTLRIAQAAARRGAGRFVFVSSIKAVAESDAGHAVTEVDPPAPHDAYGRSKLAAEQALMRYGAESGMEIVIVRPPLVYGPGVRANFLRLMDAVWKGVPLPLASIDARRSLVYVGNLADALLHCATDPRAARQCFHVCDGDDPTVAGLVRSLAMHLQRPARLWPVPPTWLRAAGKLTGRTTQIERLVGSLRVDGSRIERALDWRPPFSIQDGLAATARWYRSTH